MSETNELREVEELKKEFFDFVEDTKSISETIRKNEEHIKRYEETISHLNPENIPEDLEMKKKLESKKEELIAEGPDLIKSFKIRYGDFEISDEDKKEKTIKEMEEGTIEGKATEVLQKMNKKRREIERKIEKNKINLEQIKLKIRAHDYSDTSVNILDLYKEEEKARDEIALTEKAMDECDKAIEDIKAFDKKKEFEEVLKNENVKNTKVIRTFDDREEKEPIKPEPTKPEPIKPEPIKPEPTKPEPTKPEPTKPEPTKPEPTKPEPTKPEPTKPEPTKPEPTKPEPTKPEPTKPEPIKPEPTKPEPIKPEPINPEPVQRKDSVTIDPKTGLAVFYEEINGKSNQIAAITLEEALKNPRSVRRETFKYIKQYVEEKQGEKFEWKYRDFRRLNPVLLKLFLKAERNDLLSNYMKAANAEEELNFEYNADMELGESDAISDKILYRLNNQLLKDNNDLGTQFKAVKHLRFWHLISRIPVLNTMRLPANTEDKKQDHKKISKNLQAKIDDKNSPLSKRLKEEFPIKNDFVFDFDEMEKRKESVKTFSDEEDRDNEEEQTR